MINIDAVENAIEFENLINLSNEIFNINNYESFVNLYQTDIVKFMDKFVNSCANINSFKVFMDLYNKKYKNQNSFEVLISNFLQTHYQHINFNKFIRNNNVTNFLNNYLFSNVFILNDINLFLYSLCFKDYNMNDLNLLIDMKILSPAEENKFWLFCAKYQYLTTAFIHKHYFKFKEPELAYNLKIGNNQLYSCNEIILAKILKSADNYI